MIRLAPVVDKSLWNCVDSVDPLAGSLVCHETVCLDHLMYRSLQNRVDSIAPLTGPLEHLKTTHSSL
jgi:hypothetical protein